MALRKIDHPLFRRWTSIRQFIYNPNDPHHKTYKGLECVGLDNFDEFVEFVEGEIGELPGPEYKLNRIDQYQGWVPGNIRWADNCQIGNNRRYNIRLTYRRRTRTLAQWCEELNLNYECALGRYIRGWPTKDILFEPPKKNGYSYV